MILNNFKHTNKLLQVSSLYLGVRIRHPGTYSLTNKGKKEEMIVITT